jgi:hypothetical protein
LAVNSSLMAFQMFRPLGGLGMSMTFAPTEAPLRLALILSMSSLDWARDDEPLAQDRPRRPPANIRCWLM